MESDFKKRKYSDAFDKDVVSNDIQRYSTPFVPYDINVFYDSESKQCYTHYIIPRGVDVIKNINIDIADKVEIMFNYKKYHYNPSMLILMFASYMTCVKLRIYFDVSKLKSTFNISYDGYMIDSSLKDTTRDYVSSGFRYRRGEVSVSSISPDELTMEFKL